MFKDELNQLSMKKALREFERQRIGLVILTILLIIAAGASGMIYNSPFSPLLVLGGIAGLIVIVLFFTRPEWVLYVALLLVFLPLGLINPYTNSLLNRAFSILALVTWLFMVTSQKHRFSWHSSLTFMIGFILWCLLSLLWATDYSESLIDIQTYTLRFILFLLLVPNLIHTQKNLNRLMGVMAVIGWLIILAGIFTFITEGYTPGSRFQVFEMNENALGLVALMALPGIIWPTVQSNAKNLTLKKGMVWAYLLFTIALTAMSGSRGSILSLIVTMLMFLFFKQTRSWSLNSIFILLMIGAAAAPFFFTTILDRFAVVRGDTLLGNREGLWQAGWQLFLDHPWLGVGVGNTPKAVMEYVRYFRSVSTADSASLHNPMLTILTDTGIFGLVLYLGIPVAAVWSFIIEYRKAIIKNAREILPYFGLVASVYVGYMTSWFKGGGMEKDFGYFFLLSLLIIPATWKIYDETED